MREPKKLLTVRNENSETAELRKGTVSVVKKVTEQEKEKKKKEETNREQNLSRWKKEGSRKLKMRMEGEKNWNKR